MLFSFSVSYNFLVFWGFEWFFFVVDGLFEWFKWFYILRTRIYQKNYIFFVLHVFEGDKNLEEPRKEPMICDENLIVEYSYSFCF